MPEVSSRDPQSIYLVGRFAAPFSKDAIAHRLVDMGFDVRTAPSEGIALALVGGDPVNLDGDGFIEVEASDGYRAAVDRGATILHLRDMARLFGDMRGEWRALGAR